MGPGNPEGFGCKVIVLSAIKVFSSEDLEKECVSIFNYGKELFTLSLVLILLKFGTPAFQIF